MKCPNCRGRMRYRKDSEQRKTMTDGTHVIRMWVCGQCGNSMETDMVERDRSKPYKPHMELK